QALVERYGGEVPGKMVDLDSLPGIGRKTANVILGNAFGVPGLTVDTHCAHRARAAGPARRPPFPPPRRPLGVDRRGRSGEDRARRGRPDRASRVDDAVAPDHLPWPARLPRPQA